MKSLKQEGMEIKKLLLKVLLTTYQVSFLEWVAVR